MSEIETGLQPTWIHACTGLDPVEQYVTRKDKCPLCLKPRPQPGQDYWDVFMDGPTYKKPVVAPHVSALETQVGGSHYKDMAIQPAEYIHKNGIGFIEGACIKYLSRWRKKGGVQDLQKAAHMLEMLIEMEGSPDAS